MRIPSPDTTSLQDLYQMAGAEFQFVTETIASLKVGFPPRVLEHDASTSVRQVLSPQERITVEFAPAAAASKSKNKSKATKSKKPTKAATSTSTSTSNVSSRTGRPQRQAAKAAQQAMPEIIKAQDQLLKAQSTSSSKAKRKATSKSSTSPNNNKKKKAPNFGSQVGTGRRLADGAAVAAPKSRKRSGAASSSSSLLQPQQSSDMGESLLNALNHPGTMGQVLRKGMKHAVQASYETSRAFSRLAAIQAKSYQTQVIIMEQTAAATTNNNPNNNNVPSSKLQVTYQGSVDKTWHSDTVDCIPEEVLTQVLQGIYDSDQQEALRPENLARLSPRVLWSLVHLYPRYTTISECYQELLPSPHLDWSFLRRRAEQLSEKAAENLRQAQAQTEGGDDSSNNQNGEEQALQAVAAVEHAMEHLHDVSHRRRLASEAALARLQPSNGSNEQQQGGWKLETPSEEDREELIQIMKESSSSNAPSGNELDRLVQTFFDSGIHNWRELALVDKETAASLAPTLQVPVETLEAWIDAAQAESIPEIMVEVCDNRLDDVDLLIERARTSTPKDLALWRSMPQVLHSTIGAPSTLSVDTLRTWSERAHALLQEHEWMNWYATPVE